MTVSIIGCVVNGPGEARETDIGLTGGGNGTHMVFMAGTPDHKISEAGLIDHIVELVEARALALDKETEETVLKNTSKNNPVAGSAKAIG
jgi:(E)-4-hydroxy-3-methylbut-2-enyl-diphosphate synthase